MARREANTTPSSTAPRSTDSSSSPTFGLVKRRMHLRKGGMRESLFRLIIAYTNPTLDRPYWNRLLTIGEFEHRASGRFICAMNTHLDDLGAVARQRSAQLIVDRAKGFLARGYAITFTGDFNSQPNEDAYQTVQNGHDSPFVDAASLFSETRDTREYGHVKTYTGFDFGESTKKRIDYVFLAPKNDSPWDVKGAGVLETRFDDGFANSDHRPAVADVILK
jgi:endonuclease/exonuclease/phosphatase family metal-dependent hydrolase